MCMVPCEKLAGHPKQKKIKFLKKNYMVSPRYSLNQEDGLKILKGLGIAVGGVVITYLIELLPNVDFGSYAPVIYPLASVLLNTALKFFKSGK